MLNPEEKAKEKTIQTLLAAKKGDKPTVKGKDKEKVVSKGQSTREPAAKYKRLASDRSLDSNVSLDLGIIQTDLDSIKDSLECVLKKDDLDSALPNLVKKSDLENIVTTIVNKLINNMKKDIDNKLKEKLDKQTKAIEELRQENEQLRESIASNRKSVLELTNKVNEKEEKTTQAFANQRQKILELKSKTEDNYEMSKQSLQMANYNEQYSRKFNIKVMQCPEVEGENLREIFALKIAKEKLGVDVAQSEIQAIHRIPGKPRQTKPIIVKLINSDVKSRIMRQKKNLPKGDVRLVDDVTRHNMGLISRLSETKRFESVWYYNGSVFGKTKSGTRIKFNLFDNVDEQIAKHE